MTTPIATIAPTTTEAASVPAPAPRFSDTLRTCFYAVREGLAANDRYRTLRGNGVDHEQALEQIFPTRRAA